MKHKLTGILEFDDQQINLILMEPADRAVLVQIAANRDKVQADAWATAQILLRTYHLGAKPTPGRGYDDRLKMRLGCGDDMARELVSSGRIAHQYLGNRYTVEEKAVRDFYAGLPANSSLHKKAQDST